MHSMLDAFLERHHGLVRVGRRLPPGLPRWAVSNAVREGRLVRFLPGVYGVPAADPVRAAGLYVDGRGGLSHTSALAIWDLDVSPCTPIHLTVSPGVRLAHAGLVIHTRVEPPAIVYRDGMPLTSFDDTLVASWPMLAESDRIAALIRAVNDRKTLPSRLAAAIERNRRVPGRASLGRLVGKLDAGCRSYLELFGLDHVFHGLDFERQTPVTVDGRRYHLDLFARRERVNVELDGAAFHSSDTQREADLRRDAALATCGIQVVRFGYGQVVGDPSGVRRQVLKILDARR